MQTSRSSPAIGGAVPTQCKYALNWTRLSCHRFVANQVRLSLFILAYNLGNFLRRLCLPNAVKHWSLRSVQVKLIKMGGRLVRHSRRLIFQLSEELFKLRKRWIPLIILGIVILIAQVALWGTYIGYRATDIGEALKVTSFGGRTAADVWECREIEHPRDVCEDQERGVAIP